MSVLLQGLNPRQKQAVGAPSGPTLVLAGAGAGKTRVLTHRAAHLIQSQGVSATRLLVVTFTNKAAREMKLRLGALIGDAQVKRLWIGTFHAICVRFLRQEIDKLGYGKRFGIYDSNDQQRLMKQVLNHLELDLTQHKPARMLRQVSQLKNQGLLPVDYRRQDLDFHELTLARVYESYQEALAQNNALDFDDLLLQTLLLLRRHEDIRQRYQRHFQHLLVDEYQDTNGVQFELLHILAEKHRNLFVVGDVDQSIYSFRNADFQIILRFQQDYPGAAVIKLEDNYRSTDPILSAANTLIAFNRDRFDKRLVSVRGDGERLQLHTSADAYREADFVLAEILRLRKREQRGFGDFCILYRTNAQSRLFEERMVQNNVPHQVLGAFRFYERKEIKDLMAYLAVLNNPLDTLNLRRILNTPKRGVGAKTQAQLEQMAERDGLSLWDVLQTPVHMDKISKKARTALQELVRWLQELMPLQVVSARAAAPSGSIVLGELIERLYLESGYRDELAKDEERFEEREEYVRSFIQAALDFMPESQDLVLGDFLQHLALISDVDALKDGQGVVHLMTVHAAKGLEFPVVFVTGLEEGVFPHLRSVQAEDEGRDGPIEEERRLMYVAMTRAQDLLYLTHAQQRMQRGETRYQDASRFLEEIEDHLPEAVRSKSALDGELWSAETPVPVPSGGDLDDLSAGEKVHHPEFGMGTVDKVYVSGARPIAIVHFPSGFGKRILDLRSAPLERLNEGF